MSVAIDVEQGKQTIDSIPLSNQRFIESVYIPTAEKMGLDLLPLIIKAAGLVVDLANRDTVIAELSTMDSHVDQYVPRSNRQYVLRVSSRIRRAILEKMTDSDISLYIG